MNYTEMKMKAEEEDGFNTEQWLYGNYEAQIRITRELLKQ